MMNIFNKISVKTSYFYESYNVTLDTNNKSIEKYLSQYITYMGKTTTK